MNENDLRQSAWGYRCQGLRWADYWGDHADAIRALAPEREPQRELKQVLMGIVLLGLPA